MSAAEEAWAALTSATGWRGYTASQARKIGEQWWITLALHVGDDLHSWEVFGQTPEAARRHAVAVVREWTAGEATAGEARRRCVEAAKGEQQ